MTGAAMATAPAGYARWEGDRAAGLALADAAGWLEATLTTSATLWAWAETTRDGSGEHDAPASEAGGDRPMPGTPTTPAPSAPPFGRGRVLSVPAAVRGPDERGLWVVRHYRRGGYVARLLQDRYVTMGGTRPEAEIRASVEARARGIRTPAVVAGAWYRSGPFYRADLVTERIPRAVSLPEILFSEDRPVREPSLVAAGRLVRELAEVGIRHADLNAANVVHSDDPHARGLWVVDLDRATVGAGGSAGVARRMLARLERSLRKLGSAAGCPLDRVEWNALRAGFDGGGG